MAQDGAKEPMKVGGVIKADPNAAKKPDGAVAKPGEADTIDIRQIPLFQHLIQNGAEFYYIGQYAHMHGFVMYKDGQVQVVYVTPDRSGLVFGGMYSVDGANISNGQINEANKENVQLKALMTAAIEQQKDLARATGTTNLRDSVAEANKQILPAGGGVSLSPGERLLSDFIGAAGVVVGQEGKPLVLMLVDPHCQYCKATWAELYEPISKGVLRVKLVPIGAEGSENEKQAAKFLRAPDPLNTWQKFVGGDKSVLAGEPPASDLAAVRSSMAMVLNWKIQATPYIVYRGADSKVKVVQGKPEKIANVLADLKP